MTAERSARTAAVAGQPAVAGQQLGFEQMPRRLFRATPTRLLTWLDCPRRYHLTYLARPAPSKGPPWAHNSVGASVHTALAGWWRLPVEERTVEAAGDLLDAGWVDEGFRDQAQSLRWRVRARRMVEGYVDQLDASDEPIGVERTVALTTPRLALSGRVDRIDERLRDDAETDVEDDAEAAAAGVHGGEVELVVVDYKTGRRALTTADARTSLALAVYAAAAARTLRRPSGRVELHHLPTGAVVSWRHSEQTLRRHLARAEALGAEAAAAEEAHAGVLSDAERERWFPPRPGVQCGWCGFSAHCPQGRTASPTRRPWDGLGDDES